MNEIEKAILAMKKIIENSNSTKDEIDTAKSTLFYLENPDEVWHEDLK